MVPHEIQRRVAPSNAHAGISCCISRSVEAEDAFDDFQDGQSASRRRVVRFDFHGKRSENRSKGLTVKAKVEVKPESNANIRLPWLILARL